MNGFYLIIGLAWLCGVGLLVLGVIGLAMLVRRARLGMRLLDACADDWPAAELAIVNVRQDNQLMVDAIMRDINKNGRK